MKHRIKTLNSYTKFITHGLKKKNSRVPVLQMSLQKAVIEPLKTVGYVHRG